MSQTRIFLMAMLRGALYGIVILGALYVIFGADPMGPVRSFLINFQFLYVLPIGFALGIWWERRRRLRENLEAVSSLIDATDQDAEKLQSRLETVIERLGRKIDGRDHGIHIDPPPTDPFIDDPRQLGSLGKLAFDEIGEIVRCLERGRRACEAADKAAGSAAEMSRTELGKWKSALQAYEAAARELIKLRRALDEQHRRVSG